VVLAVDDDVLVLRNTALMLQEFGHVVLEATSGRQALDILQDRSVDLVITDHAMPKMTGVQLAAEIKTTQPDLPVILATGYADLLPGAEGGLPKLGKPFRQQDLMQAVAVAIPD
jgi:CheY-like chemotaxis protein